MLHALLCVCFQELALFSSCVTIHKCPLINSEPPSPPCPPAPTLFSEVDHSYDDKFLLVEFMGRVGLASQLGCLGALGVTAEQLSTVLAWHDAGSTVSLRFRAEEGCTHVREETREEEAKTTNVVETSFIGKVTSKVVTKVTEQVWALEGSWELSLVRGVGASPGGDVLVVGARKGRDELRTSTTSHPRPAVRSPAALADLDLSFLLAHTVSGEGSAPGFAPAFAVDRSATACATPRRNPDAEALLAHGQRLSAWARQVGGYLRGIFKIVPGAAAKLDLGILSPAAGGGTFVPVLPLFQQESSALAIGGSTGGDDGSGDGASDGPAVGGTSVSALAVAIGAGGSGGAGAGPVSRVAWSTDDVNLLLAEEARSLAERRVLVDGAFPQGQPQGPLGSAEEAWACAVCGHVCAAAEALTDGVQFVEDMLYDQLTAAIGHEVRGRPASIGPTTSTSPTLTPQPPTTFPTRHLRIPPPKPFSIRRPCPQVTPSQFDAYMSWHLRTKLFAPAFAPRAFCVAVRRSPTHSPEGTLAIEVTPSAHGGGDDGDSSRPRPIETLAALQPAGASLGFQLSASTRVAFQGEVWLHGWLRHAFGSRQARGGRDGGRGGGGGGDGVRLVATARQFSSFVVLVGRVVDRSTFDPTAAFVVKNKDEVEVPLELATLPTAAEFKDAIASLSPEQRRFASAFRAMQLNATLLGVVVVQVRPQLEAVLNLPPDSLTKEIALTSDLVELFTKYQIPPDLLSYDAAAAAAAAAGTVEAGTAAAAGGVSGASMLAAVKGHVAMIQAMIEGAGKKEVARREEEERFARPLRNQHDSFESADLLSMSAMPEPMSEMAPQMMMRRAAPVMKSMAMSSAPMARSVGGGGGGGGPGGAPQRRRMASAPPPPAAALQAAPQAAPQEATAAAPTAPSGTKRELPDSDGSGSDGGDLTALPGAVDKAYEAHAPGVRPTILTPGEAWTKRAWGALLARSATTSTLGRPEQKEAKAEAFDLLDALSRSGALPLSHAQLHVVVCATQSFEDSVVDTVVQRNVNPIQRAEAAALVLAATVHGHADATGAGAGATAGRMDAARLVSGQHLERAAAASPSLFGVE